MRFIFLCLVMWGGVAEFDLFMEGMVEIGNGVACVVRAGSRKKLEPFSRKKSLSNNSDSRQHEI